MTEAILERQELVQGTGFPAGWIKAKVGDVCTHPQYGWTTKAITAGSLKLLRTTDISSGSVDWQSVPYCLEVPNEPEKYYLQDGDILVSRAGSVGKSFLIKKVPQPSVFASYLVRFKPFICTEYVYYFMQSPYYWNEIQEKSSGIAIPNVNASKLNDIQLPVAPLNEQKRIVSKIEELFSQLDDGEAALKRAQKLVEQYRQSVLKAAVTGELTKDWREKNKHQLESGEALLQRILNARRDTWEQAELAKLQAKGKAPKDDAWKKKYKDHAAPDTTNLPELPDGWAWVRVNHVGEVQLGRQRAPQHHEGEYMRPYLRVANVYEDRINTSDVMQMNFTPQEFETYQLKYKDILLNEGQSLELVGRSAIYKNEVPGACFQNTLVRFRAYEYVLPEFAQLVFKSYLHTGRFQKIATWTTNIAHLGAGRFAELEFPLPSLQEQELIVEEVERIQSFISAVKESIQSNIRKNIALKQTILKSAFSGQLVPQDPNDEPASELLKRIAEEREAASQNGTKPKARKAKK